MSGKTISNSETKIEALKLQSSAYGVTIPMVFGVCRLAGNLLDYLGFQAVPHTETQGGKGGGVKIQNTSFSYRADVLMGLCHGPITEIPTIWRGKKQYTGGWLPTQINTASETYTPPGSGAMAYTVANAATFLSAVEVRYVETYEGESGTLTIPTVLGQGGRYTVAADGTYTFTDATLRGQELTIVYQWASGVRAQTAMDQLGLTFKAGTIGQAAWSALPSGRDIGYSGLATVAGQGYDLGTGAQVENHVFEVVGPMAYHLGTSVPDVDPAVMLRAVLTQTQGGAGFPAELLDLWQDWSSYCVAAGVLVSPAMTEQASAADIIRTAAQLTNAAPVWSGGRLKMVPLADEAEAGNGATYTPSSTPAYDLDDESYTPAAAGDSPIRVRHKASAERYNHWRVEFLNRDNQYNPEIAEAKDAADIDESGLRSAEIVKAHWICTPAAARKVAQTMLQRSLYVNSEYTVPLPWHYALIEPADLLTLADTALEMDRLPVRVTVVEENEEGDLTITAEDYPPGTASAAVYPTQAGSGYTANYNADPGNVDTPAIFEAPYTLASTGLEVYAAVRGLTSIWGGYQVWVSLDGTSYKQAGTVYGPSRYGTLADAVLAGDTSLDVEGLGATAQLLSGSAADAAGLQTLCYLGGAAEEYVAHQGATLTGPGAYTLAGLVRAAHGTTAAGHASGAPFVRVDDRIAKSGALDPVLIGSTIYFKFTSFNIWGGGQQQLADVDEWPYSITGSQAGLVPSSDITRIVITPPSAILQTDYRGIVTSFSAASADVRVRNQTGTDVTGAWTLSKADTGVASTLTGSALVVTGYDPALVDNNFAAAVLRMPLAGDYTDVSANNLPVLIEYATHTGSATGGPLAGLGYMDLGNATGGYYGNGLLIGPSRSFFADPAHNRRMRGWVKFPAGAADGNYTLMGMSYVMYLRLIVSGGLRSFYLYAQGTPVSPATQNVYQFTASASAAAIDGVWAYVDAIFDSAAHQVRLFLNGALIGGSTVGSPSGQIYNLIGAGGYSDGIPASMIAALGRRNDEWGGYSEYVPAHTLMSDVSFEIGGAVPGAGYTVPTAPLPQIAYVTNAQVEVSATDGTDTLSSVYPVTTIRSPAASIQVIQSRQSGVVTANWDASSPNYSAATVAFSIMVNGVDTSTEWRMIWESATGGDITATASGKTLTVTSLTSPPRTLRVLFTHPNYASQYIEYPVTMTLLPKPAQTWTASKLLIPLAGDTGGHVASYTGANSVITVYEGGATASGYTFTASTVTGITTLVSGTTLTITAITDAVDSGTIVMTGSKSGWPSIVVPITISKSRSLTPSGAVIAAMAPITAIQSGSGSFAVSVRINPNGTREVDRGAGWVDAGNWYNPTTTDIGASYYARMPTPNPAGYASYCTGSYGVWQSLTTAKTFVVGDDAQPVGSVDVSGQMIVSASSTGADGGLGLGLVTLIATKEGS